MDQSDALRRLKLRFSFGTCEVDIASYESSYAMEIALKRTNGTYKILDTSEGHQRAFFSMKLGPQLVASEPSRSIGICSYGSGIEPQFLLEPGTGIVYLGVDCSLVILTGNPNVEPNHLKLDAPFYFMFLVPDSRDVVVVYETGILRLTDGEAVRWQHTTDIVSSVELIAKQKLQVTLLQGGQSIIDLQTGEVTGRVARTINGK